MYNLKDIDPAVDHPAHYNGGKIECIDAMEAAVEPIKDPVAAMATGQVIKYIWRWPLKGGVQDLQKARWYLDRLIRRVEQSERKDK